NNLALLTNLLRRIGPHRALRQKRLGRNAAQIVHDKLVPGLLQIGRHAFAHHAEPDKSDAHLLLRLSPNRRGMTCAPRRRRTQRHPQPLASFSKTLRGWASIEIRGYRTALRPSRRTLRALLKMRVGL